MCDCSIDVTSLILRQTIVYILPSLIVCTLIVVGFQLAASWLLDRIIRYFKRRNRP